MGEENDVVRMAALFEAMGSGKKQAVVMARQLMKRARQIASERGISEAEAAGDLLNKVVEARHGGSSPSSSGMKPGGG